MIAESIAKCAAQVAAASGFFFIGRGYSFPIALEAALKLKEIAYVFAEGHAAGELKHGPLALIDGSMVTVCLCPNDRWREKTLSNIEEVKARGSVLVAIGHASDTKLQSLCDHWIPLPACAERIDEKLLPFFLTPLVQLLSFEIALAKGTDVDQPRNLAKSVTVE
jgi:glucosamine--fructose-6-phosphate aminotransferase (isomerizing)